MNLHQLPGANFILPGLMDLQNGESHTIGALLVAIAATRLKKAGLAIPLQNLAPEPELSLYQLLGQKGNNAYSDYNALLNTLQSFCNAIELVAE